MNGNKIDFFEKKLAQYLLYTSLVYSSLIYSILFDIAILKLNLLTIIANF